MTHVVHPYSHRLGIIRGWKSRWFAKKSDYANLLRTDVLVRRFVEKKLANAFVSSVEIERNSKTDRIVISTSRPGMIIGRNGEGATKLKKDIIAFMRKNQLVVPTDLKLDIASVPVPEADAGVVANMIAESLRKRMPFRRVMKQTIEKVMAAKGVKGARISLSGLVGGAATMARREQIKRGGIPLQFMRGDVDYAQKTARLPHNVSIKVWIYKGDTLAKSQ